MRQSYNLYDGRYNTSDEETNNSYQSTEVSIRRRNGGKSPTNAMNKTSSSNTQNITVLSNSTPNTTKSFKSSIIRINSDNESSEYESTLEHSQPIPNDNYSIINRPPTMLQNLRRMDRRSDMTLTESDRSRPQERKEPMRRNRKRSESIISVQTTSTRVTESRIEKTPIGELRRITKHREIQDINTQITTARKHLLEKTPYETPLLLRVNTKFQAVVVNIDGQRLSTPMQTVLLMEKKVKHVGLYRLVPSSENILYCTETMGSFLVHTAHRHFHTSSPIQNIRAIIAPAVQHIKMGTISLNTTHVQLMLSPEGPHTSRLLRPLYQTVPFLIAFGKHVAVEYCIPVLPLRTARIIKCKKQKIKEVDSAILYRKVDKEQVEYWQPFQVHEIMLSTVERCDPQIIRYVRMEQHSTRYIPIRLGAIEAASVEKNITTEEVVTIKNNHGNIIKRKDKYEEKELIQTWGRKTDIHRKRSNL